MHQQLPRTAQREESLFQRRPEGRQKKKNLDAAISSEAQTIAGAAKVVTH
jgi:hypothetical protein